MAELRELRVHGVAGTPAEKLLQMAPVPSTDWLVLGQVEVTGMPAQVPERRALNWSSLTSGRRRHALYVLLLPFMLLNVAGWSLSSLEGSAIGPRSVATRTQLVLVRLNGVALTVLFGAFLAVSVIDIAGRRWLSLTLSDEGWAAVAIATCGLLIVVLLWLTRVRPRMGGSPWMTTDDRVDRAGTASLVEDQQALWNTPVCAAILHRAHAAVLLATVTLLIIGESLIDLLRTETSAAGRGSGLVLSSAAVLTVSAALLGVVAVWAMSWSPGGRLPRWLVRGVRASILPAVVGFGLAGAAWAASGPGAGEVVWLVGGRGALVGAVVALVLLAVPLLLWPGARTTGGLLIIAAGVGGMFGAGLGAGLGTALSATNRRAVLEVPPSYGWLASVLTLASAVLLVVAAVAYARNYGEAAEQGNRWFVALRRTVADSPRVIGVIGGVGFASIVLLLGLVVGLFVTESPCVTDGTDGGRRALRPLDVCLDEWSLLEAPRGALGWTIAAATLAAILVCLLVWMLRGWQRVGGVAALAFLGLLAAAPWVFDRFPWGDEAIFVALALTFPAGILWSRLKGAVGDRETRRGVAVLWDVGTFWPRWFHPFAPPTYSDTAVTEIGQVIAAETARRSVILAPHSQGSIISMAAILLRAQAGTDLCRLALLTYGSPIGSHYRQVFPSQFTPAATDAVADCLSGPSGVRWRNLYRRSDPVAGPIEQTASAGVIDEPSGDDGLPDLPGQGSGHSDYWLAEVWDPTVSQLQMLLAAAGCDPVPPIEHPEGFSVRHFTWTPPDASQPIEHRVVTGGDGPPVVVLHEIPGLSPGVVDFAQRLVDEGFHVHAPVLYGRPGDQSQVVGMARAIWCLRRELDLFSRDEVSPITDWIRALVVDVATAEHPRVGIVGMCMTGGLAIAALAESATGAAVAAQPSLPARPPLLRRSARGALGLDDATLDEAVASTAPLLALRYERDWICPSQRFDTIVERFAGGSEPTIEQPEAGVTRRTWDRLQLLEIAGRGHSTLTLDLSTQALTETLAFLHANLDAPAAGA